MHLRFAIAILVVLSAVVSLIAMSVRDSSRPVLTVERLLQDGNARDRIRVGARVTDQAIEYQTTPAPRLSFYVRDIKQPGELSLRVRYDGIMPDTLKAGRDVILEGRFTGAELVATNLMTQCPSKYEVPMPDGSAAQPYPTNAMTAK